MRTKKRVALGLVLALYGYAAVAQDRAPLRIGVPTALSGPYAVISAEYVRPTEFAVAEANAKGGVDGRKVELKVLDTEAKPEVARRQAEKLALEGYNVLTGIMSSGESLAVAPMLERWDALYISTASKSARLTGDACVPRLFRTNSADGHDSIVVRKWLATRKEVNWAIMNVDVVWGRETAKHVKESLAASNKKMVSENYAPFGTNDFAPYIKQIKDSSADAVFVTMAGRDAINFLQQAKSFGLTKSVLIAGIAINQNSVLNSSGDSGLGIWGALDYSATIDTPENKAFVAAWRKAYNSDPTDNEGKNYAGMQVLFQAVERAKSVKPADIAKALRNGTFDTVYGKVSMRAADNQLMVPYYFSVVESGPGGKLVNVIKLALPPEQTTPAPDPACKL